jgi:hypothetical protein
MSEKTKLTPEQEQYLKNYESRYGRELADKMRKVMEQNAEMKEPLEVEETEKNPQTMEFQNQTYVLLPSGIDARDFIKMVNSIWNMIVEVRECEIYQGFLYSIIKLKESVVIARENKIAVAEGSERLREKALEEIPEENRIGKEGSEE